MRRRKARAQKALLISPTVPWAIEHIGTSIRNRCRVWKESGCWKNTEHWENWEKLWMEEISVGLKLGQNSNPCTGSLILGSLVLGSSVLGSSVLGLRILCPRIEDPQSWDYGSLVLGLRILSPRIEDP